MPCGRCRQLLWEHGGATLLIDHASGPLPLADLLPHAFGPDDLTIDIPDPSGR
jgi:cytidine deaminase